MANNDWNKDNNGWDPSQGHTAAWHEAHDNNYNVNKSTQYGAQDSAKWTDQDIIGDLLVSEKQMISSYSQNMCEGSNTPIRQVFKQNFDQTTQDQFQIFQQMQQRGWYQTQPADGTMFQQTMDKCTQHKNQLA
ncbi:MAG: spore coat protein [Oscillospiraceae bacterium]|jgi:spore coat protein CotF|nr:spore coat protein [Oscillospiraceae bacterium]